jgi:hypothetical protein
LPVSKKYDNTQVGAISFVIWPPPEQDIRRTMRRSINPCVGSSKYFYRWNLPPSRHSALIRQHHVIIFKSRRSHNINNPDEYRLQCLALSTLCVHIVSTWICVLLRVMPQSLRSIRADDIAIEPNDLTSQVTRSFCLAYTSFGDVYSGALRIDLAATAVAVRVQFTFPTRK